MTSSSHSLVMFPGMTPDGRIFREQQQAIPHLQIVEWPQHQAGDSIASFARRCVAALNIKPGSVVGGVSFGGIIALEVACLVEAPACLLISSVRCPAELPPWMRLARLMSALPLGNALSLAGHIANSWPRKFRAPATARCAKFSGEDGNWYRWATAAVLRWRPNPTIERLRTLRLHGERDRTFPCRYIRGAAIVPGAGHVLPLTHSSAVTGFLAGSTYRLPITNPSDEIDRSCPAHRA